MSTAELANSYAALILADDGVEITVRSKHANEDIEANRAQADKLTSLIKAANIPDVEPIWSSLFAKALEGKDVKDLLLNVGSGGGAAAAPAAGGAAAPAGGAAAETKEEEAKEEGKHYNIGGHYARSDVCNREGRVRRRYGLRSVRLDDLLCNMASTYHSTLHRYCSVWPWRL